MKQYLAMNKDDQPLGILEAEDTKAACKLGAHEVRGFFSIRSIAAFNDHGAQLREQYKQKALDQGKDEAAAEAIAEATGFKSALAGLPVYRVTTPETPEVKPARLDEPSPTPSAHVRRSTGWNVPLEEPGRGGLA